MRSFALTFCLLPFSLLAQHCGYDFAAIIVVRPHAADDTTLIEGLRITLLDSTNLPPNFFGPHFYLFRPNQDPEACRCSLYGFEDGKDRCFPFAKDNYVLVVRDGEDLSKYKLLIQDEPTRTKANRDEPFALARYKQKVVPLKAIDSYPLCGVYDRETYPPQVGRPNFAPVDIILDRR